MSWGFEMFIAILAYGIIAASAFRIGWLKANGHRTAIDRRAGWNQAVKYLQHIRYKHKGVGELNQVGKELDRLSNTTEERTVSWQSELPKSSTPSSA